MADEHHEHHGHHGTTATATATAPLFKDTLGHLYTLPGAVPYSSLLRFPLAPGEPDLDSMGGFVSVNCDQLSSWKGVWDNSTPGSNTEVTGTSSYNASGGRDFSITSTVKGGGFRYSCHAVPSGAQNARYFVYEVIARAGWPQATRCENDINCVNGKCVMMACLQQECGSPNGLGLWDVTFNEGWSHTAVPAQLPHWTKNSSHEWRTHTKFDNSGNAEYIGVNVDGIWYPINERNVGFSNPSLSWEPNGLIIPNWQFEILAGTMTGNFSLNVIYK